MVMETLGTGAGQLNIKIQIGSVWIKDFVFRTYSPTTELYTDDDLNGATFSFFLKKFKGDRLKVFNLTLGNGIALVTYVSNRIRITASSSQTAIEEGDYYYELRRTDLDKAKVSGLASLTFDAQQ